jgi:molybdenum cofactor cytidylyltransferase
MGAWKPLLPFGASTIAETTVASALGAWVGGARLRVVLVVGFRGEELAARFPGNPRVTVVENPGWKTGMLGSIQAALAHIASDRFFTIPADMPLVPSSVYARLAEAWDGSRPLFASYHGEPGHPVLVPASLIPAILALDPGARLRPFLFSKGGSLIDCGTEAVLADIDTATDLEWAKAARG